jgi:hypothetical protein
MPPFGAIRGLRAAARCRDGRRGRVKEREKEKGGISHFSHSGSDHSPGNALLGVPQIMGGQIDQKRKNACGAGAPQPRRDWLPQERLRNKGMEMMMRLRRGCLARSCDGRSWLLICRRGAPKSQNWVSHLHLLRDVPSHAHRRGSFPFCATPWRIRYEGPKGRGGGSVVRLFFV